MAAIEVIVFTVAAGFAFAVVITIMVIIGVRKEERYLTLMNRTAPGAAAQLARIVLGRYVRTGDSTVEGPPPDDTSGALEHSASSRR